MRSQIVKIHSVFFCLMGSALAWGQEPPPPQPEDIHNPFPELPIDSGLIFLLLLGLALGILFLLRKKQASKL